MDFDNLYCARCGAEMKIALKNPSPYTGSLRVADLFCPFCGDRRLTSKEGGIWFDDI